MLKIFMYGSCVSRDTFDFFSRESCLLLGYVSRQSVISAFYPADPGVLTRSSMSSKFQMRNSVGDFDGDLLARIDTEGQGADVILWDIIDERNGVVKTTEGGYVTFTYDLFRADVFSLMKEIRTYGERIGFGSDQHFDLWRGAADRFIHELDVRGLRSKLLLLVAPWAEVTNEGNPPNVWSLGPTVSQANMLFERYYDYLRDVHNLATVRLPSKAVVSRQDHKWGPAPYHYVDEAYAVFRKGIEEFAGIG